MLLWLRQRGRNRLSLQRRQRLGSASFWLEGLALPLAALTLEGLPVSAWLHLGAAWLVGDADQVLLPTWGLLVILLVAYGLARCLAAPPTRKRWPSMLISLGWGLSLVLAWYLRFYAPSGALWQGAWLGALFADLGTGSHQFAGVIGLVLLISYLWWRGLLLGRFSLEFEQISRTFKLGAAGVVVALLVLGAIPPAGRSGLERDLGFTLPAFLFVGLAALSLARLAEIGRVRRAGGDPQANPTRSWVLALLALSGGLVLLTLLLEQLFSYPTWLALIKALQPLWDGIGTVLGWLALGLAYLLYWIFNPLVQWVRELLSSQHNAHPPRPIGPPPTLPRNGSGNGIPIAWQIIGQWVLMVAGTIVLLLILRRALRVFASWQRPDGEEEEREDLGATRMLGEQLRALLASLAAHFLRRRAGEAAQEEQEPRGSVRALYRRLLRQVQAQGRGRRATETPTEFAHRLGPLLVEKLPDEIPTPEQQPVHSAPLDARLARPLASQQKLAALTAAYEQARYGNQEASPEELQTLAEGLDHLLERLAAHREHPSEPTL